MNWSEFLAATYYRLFVRLKAHEKALRAADKFLARYGFNPDDPVRSEVIRSVTETHHAVEAVRRAYDSLPRPYRPGIDPYRTQGLAASLRADFAAKGITEPQRDRPPLPPP